MTDFNMMGLLAPVLDEMPGTMVCRLRLSPVFRVPFCPRPGFQKRLGDKASAVRRRVISRQKLRQIVRQKGSKTSSRLRVFR
jgi:hypothetical protein